MNKEKKTILEELVKKDARFLMDKALDMPLSSGFQNLRAGNFSESVAIATTPCFFGGKRYWFLCPLCNQRVAALYLKSSFGCRACHNLSYASQNVNRYSQHFPLLRLFRLDKQIQELEKNTRRQWYAGKPTKKQVLLTSLQKSYLQASTPFLET